MEKLLAKMDGSVPWLRFRGSLGSSSNRFYVDFFSNNKLDRWGPTHGVKTKNSDERWGLEPTGDRDRDSYFLLVTETHVVGDGNQYSHLRWGKGTPCFFSWEDNVCFLNFRFSPCAVKWWARRDNNGSVFVSRKERKKRSHLLLCFL
jgi:hypothetical protein